MTSSRRPRGACALVVVSLLCCAFSFSAVAAAADGDAEDGTVGEFLKSELGPAPVAAEVPSLTESAIKILVALCVVLALVVGLAFLLKRATYRMRQVGGGTISVVSQVPLGPSQFLSVVDIAGEIVVLGVTEHSVTALSTIEDTAAVEQLRSDPSGSGKPALLQGVPGFRQWLDRAQRGDA
ncbi:flagellar biosynthetic protein FliO [Candidatus Poribacteria bacterium]|jgi:flagellar protein FliO/FliZ|nr:flagellar biosynthetic protein FliO [Candidatus Poribacteria bacterium]MBT5533084.1 flagellar biosynthetic protein FliO [Candidatus Poribacteria bacterium]MBT5709576.1 flagellar biosynthetic protein FliO [Candidatus Poribacteria bacterium]MBT7098563.1 flagellar biosynthetic protein FliO [Candidatus Poribacteria bacterium]MBT7809146.1 flagellar biosynthetic protein FliO [Candidatus Poribacteria bacterium]